MTYMTRQEEILTSKLNVKLLRETQDAASTVRISERVCDLNAAIDEAP